MMGVLLPEVSMAPFLGCHIAPQKLVTLSIDAFIHPMQKRMLWSFVPA
jgi:hypothetical protein